MARVFEDIKADVKKRYKLDNTNQLGSGADSIVWPHTNDTVIKLTSMSPTMLRLNRIIQREGCGHPVAEIIDMRVVGRIAAREYLSQALMPETHWDNEGPSIAVVLIQRRMRDRTETEAYASDRWEIEGRSWYQQDPHGGNQRGGRWVDTNRIYIDHERTRNAQRKTKIPA